MEDVTSLVSLRDAKRHLREGSAAVVQTDAEIQAKLYQATAFVLRLCGSLADDTWDETTVPVPVHTAILLHLAELYAERGDGEKARPFGEDAARYLIATGYRDPVVA